MLSPVDCNEEISAEGSASYRQNNESINEVFEVVGFEMQAPVEPQSAALLNANGPAADFSIESVDSVSSKRSPESAPASLRDRSDMAFPKMTRRKAAFEDISSKVELDPQARDGLKSPSSLLPEESCSIHSLTDCMTEDGVERKAQNEEAEEIEFTSKDQAQDFAEQERRMRRAAGLDDDPSNPFELAVGESRSYEIRDGKVIALRYLLVGEDGKMIALKIDENGDVQEEETGYTLEDGIKIAGLDESKQTVISAPKRDAQEEDPIMDFDESGFLALEQGFNEEAEEMNRSTMDLRALARGSESYSHDFAPLASQDENRGQAQNFDSFFQQTQEYFDGFRTENLLAQNFEPAPSPLRSYFEDTPSSPNRFQPNRSYPSDTRKPSRPVAPTPSTPQRSSAEPTQVAKESSNKQLSREEALAAHFGGGSFGGTPPRSVSVAQANSYVALVASTEATVAQPAAPSDLVAAVDYDSKSFETPSFSSEQLGGINPPTEGGSNLFLAQRSALASEPSASEIAALSQHLENPTPEELITMDYLTRTSQSLSGFDSRFEVIALASSGSDKSRLQLELKALRLATPRPLPLQFETPSPTTTTQNNSHHLPGKGASKSSDPQNEEPANRPIPVEHLIGFAVPNDRRIMDLKFFERKQLSTRANRSEAQRT